MTPGTNVVLLAADPDVLFEGVAVYVHGREFTAVEDIDEDELKDDELNSSVESD